MVEKERAQRAANKPKDWRRRIREIETTLGMRGPGKRKGSIIRALCLALTVLLCLGLAGTLIIYDHTPRELQRPAPRPNNEQGRGPSLRKKQAGIAEGHLGVVLDAMQADNADQVLLPSALITQLFGQNFLLRICESVGWEGFDFGPRGNYPETRGSEEREQAVSRLNDKFGEYPIKEQPMAILRWAGEVLPTQEWAQVTSFGLGGLSMTHMLQKLGLLSDAKIITIDTLHLFNETYSQLDDVKTFFGLQDLQVYRNRYATTRTEFEAQYGSKLWKVDPALYDFVAKIEPTKRALDNLHIMAWITGRRKSQGGERIGLQLFEMDAADGRLKINPMANWQREDVWNYVKRNKLPYNKLHDKGYQSVGDIHSTQAVEVSEGERAGRFKGENRTECGIHHHHSSESVEGLAKRAERIRTAYKWERAAQERASSIGIAKVTEESFGLVVMDSPETILLEAYSPLCPHCRNFEPTFNEIAKKLIARGKAGSGPKVDGKDHLRVARLNLFENSVPQEYSKIFTIDSYPSMYLVMKGMKRMPIRFNGKDRDEQTVLKWVEDQVTFASRNKADAAAMHAAIAAGH